VESCRTGDWFSVKFGSPSSLFSSPFVPWRSHGESAELSVGNCVHTTYRVLNSRSSHLTGSETELSVV